MNASVASSAAPSASFEERVVTEQLGDVANITVQTSQPATVNLGSPETSFWMQVKVGGGTTKLRLNTYKAGESDRYATSEMVWSDNGNIQSRRLMTRSIDAPLDVADYHMNVTIQGNEHAIGTLRVEDRTTHAMSARISPRATDVSGFASESDLREASVKPWNDSVAHDDWLFVRVNASGLRGALTKSRLNGDGDIARVDFEQTNPPMNGNANEFTGASVERLLTPDGIEGFYLVVNTGDHGVEPGDRYEITVTVPEDGPLADETETLSKEIRVVERRVQLDGERSKGPLVVEDETTITGTATLTPGTTINVSARDPNPDPDPFLIPGTVTVGADRTFSVTMDFSEFESGRQFEFRLADQGRTIPAVVEGLPTTTAESTTTETTTESTTTEPSGEGNGSDSTTQTTTTTTVEGLTQVAVGGTQGELTQQEGQQNASEENDGLVPGFGPIPAVVALLAAALLAIRRR